MNCTCSPTETCAMHRDVEASGWIQTYAKRRINPVAIRSDDILIEDIAHALALQCRFSGHVSSFYSVAQHAVHVSQLCDPVDALWGLLHDAAEAYLVDLPRPIKHRAGYETYRADEDRLMAAVCVRFGLACAMPASVRHADEIMLVGEARDLMAPLVPGWRHTVENGYTAPEFTISPWDWRYAEVRFLERFHDLTRLQAHRPALAAG